MGKVMEVQAIEARLDLLPRMPDMSHIITEDDEPVDNLFSAKQQRLLVEPLYTAWQKERVFLADANVGVFRGVHIPPLVPDMFLSMDVRVGDEDWWLKENRSYFIWIHGKPPDVVVEVVSNAKGGELDRKMRGYARMGIPYYVVYDPEPSSVQSKPLVVYELVVGEYLPRPDYQLAKLGLSLRLWDGVFEGGQAVWLRWADVEGNFFPTGAELSDRERERADQAEERTGQERERAERMAAKLRALGIDPESV